MSGWVVPSQTRSAGIQLPPGLQVAATGSRVGAWLLDRMFFVVLAGFLAGVALIFGAVNINPAASDQIQAGTSANLITVPLLTVKANLLIVFGAAWVLIQYAYAALSWTLFRGTAGQRILSLQVADAATGHSLTIWRSSLRWLVLESVPQIALAIFLVLFVRMMGEVPPSVYGAGASSGSNTTYTTVSLVGNLAALLSAGWRLALLVITTTHAQKRGLHDRIAGSLVVGRASAASYWAQSANGGPGWPGGPVPPAPGSGPGYPYASQVPQPGQWPAPSGPEATAPPESSTHYPEPIGQPEHRGEPPIEQPRPAFPGGQAADSWTPPSAGWASPNAGWNQPPVGGSRQTKDPNWIWQPSEESMPRAYKLADGHELPVGLRVPDIARRLGGYIIDCAIVWFFYSVWLGVLGYAGGEKQAIVAGVIAGVGQLAYFVGCWRLFRGTVGQRVLHLQIGDLQTGNALTWGDSFMRWCILQGPFALATVLPIVLFPAVVFGAAGWAAFLMYDAYYKPDHRAVHDRAVHSLVAQTS